MTLRALFGPRFERPTSPALSEAATEASALDFGLGEGAPEKIITRAQLKTSIGNYEKLVSSCAAYRSALMALSKATAAFADAMGACAGLPGPSYEAGTRLQAASGLHHLMGNHWHILAETCDREFEQPLKEQLKAYRADVSERTAAHERALRATSAEIRATERRNGDRTTRNLPAFRANLAALQRALDALDARKRAHYSDIVVHEEAVWAAVQARTSVVVRSTMDVFDRLTAKASDPVLEPMLSSVPDPFDAYGPAPAPDRLFSILPPLAIAAPSPAPSSAASEAGEPTWGHGGYFAAAAVGADAWAESAAPNTLDLPTPTSPHAMDPSTPTSDPPMGLLGAADGSDGPVMNGWHSHSHDASAVSVRHPSDDADVATLAPDRTRSPLSDDTEKGCP